MAKSGLMAIPCSEDEDKLDILSWDVNPFETSDACLIKHSIDIFNHYELMRKFRIDHVKMNNFLRVVYSNYRHCPFHNFKHAWSVFQVSFLILQAGADKKLFLVDVLSVLVAAICHDLDHPGNNNAFEVATNSALYQKYQNKSVLEHHHLNKAVQILSTPETDILSNLDNHLRAVVLGNLHAGIMATDMSNHFLLMDALKDRTRNEFNPFDVQQRTHRKLLIELIVHCADLSGQALKRELALEWGNRVLIEFDQQVQHEKEFGVPVTTFMTGLDNMHTRYNVQIGFVSTFIIPQWSLMTKCFPPLLPRVNHAQENLAFYKEMLLQLTTNPTSTAASTVAVAIESTSMNGSSASPTTTVQARTSVCTTPRREDKI